MLTYNGWSYTWSGSQLATAADTGNSISYQYNSDGIRTSKTVNGVTTFYTLDDNNNITSQSDGTNTIDFTYDGNLEYMTLNGTKYTYETNAQGDVTGLVDSGGSEVVTYTYDTWGKLLGIGGPLASTVGVLNPFRYRGYYYDTETGLYYLQSRYYDPEFGRFISKDDPSYHDGQDAIGSNLYAYADNNPVINSDSSGYSSYTANINTFISLYRTATGGMSPRIPSNIISVNIRLTQTQYVSPTLAKFYSYLENLSYGLLVNVLGLGVGGIVGNVVATAVAGAFVGTFLPQVQPGTYYYYTVQIVTQQSKYVKYLYEYFIVYGVRGSALCGVQQYIAQIP
jgi:RHS repeat-associated protein